MKQNMLKFCTLALTWVALTEALREDYMNYNKRIDLPSPTFGGSLSAGILKSHSGMSYLPNLNVTVNLSAPDGFMLSVAVRLIDLRPLRQDSLTLFNIDGMVSPVTYLNKGSRSDRTYHPKEDRMYVAPNGKVGVTFTTGPSFYTAGYEGFELIYTVQDYGVICSINEYRCGNGRCIALSLTCNGHNHCGDQSSLKNCPEYSENVGRKVGITFGVVFLCIAIGCGIFIIFRRSRRSTTSTIVTTHPPPRNNLTSYPPGYPQPGGYPPPPPKYSQGITNPTYR